MATIEAAAPPALAPVKGRSIRKRFSAIGVIGISILIVMVAAAVFGPPLWGVDPLEQQIEIRLQGPSAEHPLGTDQFGRDIFARLLTGARWTLLGAFAVCVGVSLIGFTVAAIAVAGSRLTDNTLGRLIESLMAMPGLVTALAFTAVLGPSFRNLLLAIVITAWPWYARAYRSIILKERSALYVEGAVCLGANRVRVLTRHIVPNVIGPSLVLATTNLGGVILSLAALSFLGLGIQPPTPEWGAMINDAKPFFQRHPWQMIVPGLCIVFTVLAVNLTGDALRDALDPRTATGRRR